LGIKEGDELSALEAGRMIKDYYTGKDLLEARAATYSGPQAQLTTQLRNALMEIQKLGLTGQKLTTKTMSNK
jgi:hypothetical protein